jgi:hypothetical protein
MAKSIVSVLTAQVSECRSTLDQISRLLARSEGFLIPAGEQASAELGSVLARLAKVHSRLTEKQTSMSD